MPNFLPLQDDAEHQRFLRPEDGKLSPLLVQSFEHPAQLQSTREWTQIGQPCSQIPSIVGLVYWIWAPALQEGTEERRYDVRSCVMIVLRWIVSCPFLLLMLCTPRTGPAISPMTVEEASYAAIPSQNQNRSQSPSRPTELVIQTRPESAPLVSGDDPDTTPHLRASEDIRMLEELQSVSTNPTAEVAIQAQNSEVDDPTRLFRPRYLCFLCNSNSVDSDAPLYQTVRVSKWIEMHGDVNTEYVFVSYTQMQFRVNTEDEIAAYPYPDEETRDRNREAAKHDRATLIRWGIEAAQSAGVGAFWLDFECLRDDDDVARSTSASDDVYRICDVVRTAHSMIIAVGPPVSTRITDQAQPYSSEAETLWLREWGSRLWTLPEILLCPSEHRVKLYAMGGPEEPKRMAKRNFAERAWIDAGAVGQLIDHYESSVHLTPLQLIGIALECFSRRKTDQWVQGDVAYALMGLLRQRPQVNEQDSGFQAFARLSLANDSNHILERLLCMLPPRKGAPWHELRDAWNAKLWDIIPSCQIADVVDEQTVTLDGAYGATIIWDKVDPVKFSKVVATGSRSAKALTYLPAFCLWPLLAVILFVAQVAHPIHAKPSDQELIRQGTGFFLIISLFLFFLAASIFVATPWIILRSRMGALQTTQARFIGIEGHVEPGLVERYLFGFNHGRLKESAGSSTFSRTRFEDNQRQSGPSDTTFQGQAETQRLLTLVDTYAMVITHFYADRPPVAVFICGQEHGMQRAVLCSYDCASNKYCRETILRMKTPVLGRMTRVDKFKFALDAPMRVNGGNHAMDSQAEDVEEVYPRRDSVVIEGQTSRWKIDLAFVLFMWYTIDLLAPGHVHRTSMEVHECLAFALTQVPAYYALRRFQLRRILSLAVQLKVLAHMALIIAKYFLPYQNIVLILKGIANGIILPAFATVTWSWYKPKEVPLRLLLWTMGGSIISRVLLTDRIDNKIPASGEKFALFLFLAMRYLASYAYHRVGMPGEVRWMPTEEQIHYASTSAASKYVTPWAVNQGWMRRKVSQQLVSPQTWFVFLISFLHTALQLQPLPFDDNSANVGLSFVVGIAVGTAFHFYNIPKIPTMAACTFLSLTATILLEQAVPWQNAPHWIPLYAVVCLQNTVLPLLWSLIVLNTSHSADQTLMLCVSTAGLGLGKAAFLTLLHKTGSRGTLFQMPQLLLLAAWLCDCVRQNKRLAKRAAEMTSEQSEFGPVDANGAAFRLSY